MKSRQLGWLVVVALARTASAAPSNDSSDKKLDPKNLSSLTRDPIVGKADRIDGDEASGMVAFTFDDGPNPETTPRVIDALEKYDIPATFFIVTSRLSTAKGRALLHRELEAGFTVGSHSRTHPNLRKASEAKLEKEIDGSIRTLAVEADRPIGMFRAPYGALNAASRGRLKKLGLTEVFWSIDTLDWKAHHEAKLRKKVMSMIKKDNGGVVLMHDVKEITATIIAGVLDDLEAENCARLADGQSLIVPVSLHYFLKDGKKAREIPKAVAQRTEAYKNGLADRCARRPAPANTEAPQHAAR